MVFLENSNALLLASALICCLTFGPLSNAETAGNDLPPVSGSSSKLFDIVYPRDACDRKIDSGATSTVMLCARHSSLRARGHGEMFT